MSEPEETEYGLVMPFVTVTSKGGPHDDQSYVAGWAMGALDTRLEATYPDAWNDMIRADCAPQADRIAMKHGYVAEFGPDQDGWVHMQLKRSLDEVIS
ncbi:hypothetical protein [Amycolatopsis circi]|uniref:hypothetical protein n=1 Tax=Amycolatopsis circi TaxID=871959 RepID=UPI000E24217D|nr:hypothetical protein [Amycolatopsis circi]